MIVIGSEEVARELDRPGCITLMREAMIALSAGRTRQLLRGIIDLGGGDLFGVMPGAMEGAGFGAKLVSVFRSAAAQGRSHQGAILLFDRETGAPVCVVDAGEVTAIRTACRVRCCDRCLGAPGRNTSSNSRYRRAGLAACARDESCSTARTHCDLGAVRSEGTRVGGSHQGRARPCRRRCRERGRRCAWRRHHLYSDLRIGADPPFSRCRRRHPYQCRRLELRRPRRD